MKEIHTFTSLAMHSIWMHHPQDDQEKSYKVRNRELFKWSLDDDYKVWTRVSYVYNQINLILRITLNLPRGVVL